MAAKVDAPRAGASIVRVLLLLSLVAGIVAFVANYLESRAAEDRGRQVGSSAEVRIGDGSQKATLKIAVTNVRPGTIEDLAGFDVPVKDQDKIPHYIWFRSKITSGSLNPEEAFPITSDQWEAVSSGGETLKAIHLGGDLQPCPRISNERLLDVESDEGCFMVFNEAGKSIQSVALNAPSGEIIRWRF